MRFYQSASIKALYCSMNSSNICLPSLLLSLDLNEIYRRAGDWKELNDNDLGVYIQVLEEALESNGIAKTEILEKMKKHKEKIDNKTKVSKVTGINRKNYIDE